jgi:hypothetical protein
VRWLDAQGRPLAFADAHAVSVARELCTPRVLRYFDVELPYQQNGNAPFARMELRGECA